MTINTWTRTARRKKKVAAADSQDARFLRTATVVLALLLSSCASLPPEHFVKVGSTQIAVSESTGTGPTVIFQSGLGDGMSTWAAVIKRLPPEVSLFAYDRPGYGSSDPLAGQVRDSCHIARELREVLQTAGVPPPYLLVGHSLGGQYQYAFARLFPEDVEGMILLDPTHPDHWVDMQEEEPKVAATLTGLKAVMFSSAMKAEFDAQGACLEPPRRLNGQIPLRLLLRTRYDVTETPAFRTMVERLEADWLSFSADSSRSAIDRAGHYIQKDRPDVVASEILLMLQAL